MSQKIPLLVALPHCSHFVPSSLRRIMSLSDFEIKKHTDSYTDQIFNIPNAHIVKAKISRLVADPNRAPDDIEMECKLSHDGVVVSITEDGKAIYRTPPSVEDIFARVSKYHDTFHEKIEEIAPEVKFMIDGHSYLSVGPATKIDAGKPRADIMLGNRNFTTCSREMTLKIKHFFEQEGYSVRVNFPYSAKYVVGYHCSRKGLPGTQIEVSRRLYMNEETLAPFPDKIASLNKVMIRLSKMIVEEIEKQEFLKNGG